MAEQVHRATPTPSQEMQKRYLLASAYARYPIAKKALQITDISPGKSLLPDLARCPIERKGQKITGKRARPGKTGIARWKMAICRKNTLPGERAAGNRKKSFPRTAAA
jgi:hypothetical protein